ncbi:MULTISPECIES: PhzF family phenazine biosynthesis protein [Subtercola]|uniref:PhzF family phenazine biosynthesis protein n=1 Tax=Subtercola vilae TaxID=2056433 RepID=A0A4T2BSC4_9MICO|nr:MULTISPECIES: PhzF family phenazine biosynthesis protein [Subtercola]MEA9986758.1 PhzF family phenazine biosynthesis protein [Subtercola sp. RTI3]TIH34367.1 PhzF family phenazine biosynthesis protein [Subtercola vilae]
MTSQINIDVVRVFTDDSGAFGNELGIVRSSSDTAGREQAIAARLGFSETVFIDALRGDASLGVAAVIRIFTPAAELPFAGHPSVGAAWWLAREGLPVAVLAEGAGDVAVRYDGEVTWITGRASWAPEFEWVPVETPAAVDAIRAEHFTSGHHYVWSWVDEPNGVLRSRMFAPDMGIVEDEATGAAAVRITALLGRGLDIRQGRGSRIVTRLVSEADGRVGVAADIRVEVGGRAVFDRMIALDIEPGAGPSIDV